MNETDYLSNLLTDFVILVMIYVVFKFVMFVMNKLMKLFSKKFWVSFMTSNVPYYKNKL